MRYVLDVVCDLQSRMRRVVGGVPFEKSLVFGCAARSPPFFSLVIIKQTRRRRYDTYDTMPTKRANVARFDAIRTRDSLHLHAISVLRRVVVANFALCLRRRFSSCLRWCAVCEFRTMFVLFIVLFFSLLSSLSLFFFLFLFSSHLISLQPTHEATFAGA